MEVIEEYELGEKDIDIRPPFYEKSQVHKSPNIFKIIRGSCALVSVQQIKIAGGGTCLSASTAEHLGVSCCESAQGITPSPRVEEEEGHIADGDRIFGQRWENGGRLSGHETRRKRSPERGTNGRFSNEHLLRGEEEEVRLEKRRRHDREPGDFGMKVYKELVDLLFLYDSN